MAGDPGTFSVQLADRFGNPVTNPSMRNESNSNNYTVNMAHIHARAHTKTHILSRPANGANGLISYDDMID